MVLMVTKEDWVVACQDVKDKCIFIAKGLKTELDKRFILQGAMNPIGIQYWVQPKVTMIIPKHLQIQKSH